MRPSLALGFVAALAAVAGCLVDLEPRQDCGDGYVDELAGEQCEPTRADSFDGLCPVGEVPGPGACNPQTCTLDSSKCTRCGNGSLDPGEACDPQDMNQPTCPLGGVARCRSDCTVDPSGCARGCTDGVVDLDLGEECDLGPVTDVTDKGAPVKIDCRTLQAPSARAYGSGDAQACVNCRWDRSNCSYCGNNRLESLNVVVDEQLHLDFDGQIKPLPEVCDRDDTTDKFIADPQALSQFCQETCNAGDLTVACAYSCSATCDAFAEPAEEPEDHGCCIPRGSPCPYDANGLMPGHPPCCGASEDVEDPAVLCIEKFDLEGGLSFPSCR